MEGGVAWARSLYCDLISHWEKRNRTALENYNPALVDHSEFNDLAARYGGSVVEGHAEGLVATYQSLMTRGEDPSLIDEWAPSGIKHPRDIYDIFTRQFYFGCEGDDPLVTLASAGKGSPFDAKLCALYGSDLGHWDVPEMAEAAEEAYELVEHGVLSEDAFRDLVFTNAAEFWASGNLDFFKGTVVESAVNKLRASP
jgi:hypothetical protein